MITSREVFREGVFLRDEYQCVVCESPGKDAHHLMERRLFPDGGYVLDNGVTLCADCHIKAEETVYSPELLRDKAGINTIILPPHLYIDQKYDKWGNPILSNGLRLRGELFNDESVQKILPPDVKANFTHWVKYPRTYHLPWSKNINDDDRVMTSLDAFVDTLVVVTEKMDGENTTMYSDHIHARSLDSRTHPSRNWVKNFWSTISHDIPVGWRICGENLYAEHSIHYHDLPTYFMGFSMWNDHNECLSWPETLEWFSLLGIIPVPVLYAGVWDMEKISSILVDSDSSEGYVVRVQDKFPLTDFKRKVGKYVRENHIQSIKHWFYGQSVTPNTLCPIV